MNRPLGYATVQVLQAIASGYVYGFDIMDATGLPSGTVYPILSKLEDCGFLKSRWEDPRIARLKNGRLAAATKSPVMAVRR